MKGIRMGVFATTCAAAIAAWAMGACGPDAMRVSRQANAAESGQKLKVAVLTGGHGFDHKSFFSLFEGFSDVTVEEIVLKKDSTVFDDISQWLYDVILMYHMTQEITDKQKENFLKLLDKGVGVVAMHHCFGGHQGWDEFSKIIGGRYCTRKTVVDGKTVTSTFKEGVDINVHVEDAAHPVTAGLKDFVVRDEVYGNCRFEPDNQCLLTTDQEKSDKKLAWVRKYRNSNVCTILLGHGKTIFSDASFQRLVHNAILWAARRSG